MFLRGKIYPHNKCYKVNRLIIKRFRRIVNQTVPIGANITLIAGQNGTSKSTLLGLIAHPFSTKNDEMSVYVRHYGNSLEGVRTINNKPFEADYRQMFRMEKGFDEPGSHEYSICITGPDLINAEDMKECVIPVKSRFRNQTRNQLRLVSGRSHTAGEGNFPHPVIYLGLGRLAPLAECQKMSVEHNEEALTEEEAKWLHKKNAEILSLNESPSGIDVLDSGLPGKGAFPASRYEDYNPATYSAGQDNLGQILIALLSFRRLKQKLGEKYAGGILFVDELDSALFPSAQTRLLDILAEESQLLGLQIIATTHSVTMMHHAFHSSIKQYTNIVFLKPLDGNVVVESDVTYAKIKTNLLIEYNPGTRPALFFEDSVAVNFFNLITRNCFTEEYELIVLGSAGVLENIASNPKIQERLSAVMVLDADRAKPSELKNVVFLPGKLMPLERELYFFLKELPDSDGFWNQERGFTKQFLFKCHCYDESENVDNYMKTWFAEQNTPEWGENGKHALQRWIADNRDICREFCKKLIFSIRSTVPTAPKLDEIGTMLDRYYMESLVPENNQIAAAEGLELFDYAAKNPM